MVKRVVVGRVVVIMLLGGKYVDGRFTWFAIELSYLYDPLVLADVCFFSGGKYVGSGFSVTLFLNADDETVFSFF